MRPRAIVRVGVVGYTGWLSDEYGEGEECSWRIGWR